MKTATSGLLVLLLIICTGIPTYAQGKSWEKLNTESTTLYKQGRYDEAIVVAKEALDVAEKTVGPNHRSVAASLNILAMLYYAQSQYSAAVPIYRLLADTGDVEANRRLGDIFRFGGSGVEKDEAEAVRRYRKAALAGDEGAVSKLRSMYGIGRGAAPDEVEAVKTYRVAADRGDKRAMTCLGLLYEFGRGVEKDEAEAVRWYRKAAEGGDEGAMVALGFMLNSGRGVAKDDAEALRWYRLAADAGNARALNNLGVAYANGRGVDKDEAEATRWYRKAAEAGDVAAMNNVGRAYATGRGVAKDEAEAVRWYRKGSDAGNIAAMNNLGVAYVGGRGVAKNETEAVRWYRKAAEAGDPVAMNHMGRAYATGRGVARDEAEAVRWYRKGSDVGNIAAMNNLGVAYVGGRGVAKDETEAVRWYRKAAEAGDPVAMDNMGRAYATGQGVAKDEAEAVRWYRKGSDAGNIAAMNNLGVAYEGGRGVAKDETEAARWYRKAAEAGDPGEPMRVGPGVTPPRLLRKVEPEYTPSARADHIQGTVILQIVVNEKGRAADISVLSPLGFGLDEKAQAAVEKWEFAPGMKGGIHVKILAEVMINFRFPGLWFDEKTERQRTAFNIALQTANRTDASPAAVDHAVQSILDLSLQKFAPAMCVAGLWKTNGEHVAKDAAGLDLIQKAADKNYGPALYLVAVRHIDGRDLPLDIVKGLEEMRAAATLGSWHAQFYLGNRYETGDGVPRELDRATRYYRLCAAQGVATCQYRLGRLLYEAPDRREREYLQAVALFQLAAEQGVTEAKEVASTEESRLTPEQHKWVTTLRGQVVRK